MAYRDGTPGWPGGALVGVLLTAALLGVLYLGRQLAGLPFAPFAVFDWSARTLPGPLITFGIDTMVGAIRGLGIGDLSQAAKTGEQILAVIGFLLTGTVIAALLFQVLRWRGAGRGSGLVSGLGVGVALGAAVIAIALTVGPGPTAPVLSAAWLLLTFGAWGGFVGWSRDRLTAAVPGGGDPSVASVERLDRRRFLVRLGGSAAVITVGGAVVGAWVGRRGGGAPPSRRAAWSDENPLPNAGAAVQPVPGTRPELTPVAEHYRIDINTTPPEVAAEDWTLRVRGLVDRPRTWRLADLRDGYEPLVQFITLACISNPIAGSLTSTQRWTGVPLRLLLREVGLRPEATHLRIRSVDGFHETLAVRDAMADERIMLTYAWDGLPLPTKHGFPLRVYIPDRYGMKQPKWIEEIEAVDHPEEGYWVRRGWDPVARMHATSVIDTVGVDMMVGEAGPGSPIPIGGIAHAGARGISRVEVRVDDGAWEPAALRDPLSGTTWVIWRYDWPFREGEHTFTVRCVDGAGARQVEERTPVRPAGATGLHRREVML